MESGDLTGLLRARFGFSEFRRYQEEVCRAVLAGRDALVVMPTGAGKSLCYELPGIALGGTTLVVSPLIALMEDQVQKLGEHGLKAERIHSGRPRAESRRVCTSYLAGELDFLYIAPERLSVPGFPEMLTRRKPVLVAIDEAHCISHWGHDFRPDYRLLRERLRPLRPAPVIALTATATPQVQTDIAEQLELDSPSLHIHGFRRDNIAIEVAEMRPSARPGVVASVLADPDRRPALVYAPTRKESEALAGDLAAEIPAGAYHAGMSAGARDETQSRFLTGELEVIVATIAFGMGVDKPDIRTVLHTGLPGTLEGYYQEVGRAGRDGQPSRAILLYSWADRRTHEYFHGRSYPEADVLESLYQKLGREPVPGEELRARLRMDEDLFEPALEKLWIHGGALVDPEENVSRGKAEWREAYLIQRRHKLEQLAEMTRFADGHTCRMLHMVQHFGDLEDSGAACDQCDVCRPESCLARRYRDASDDEIEACQSVVEALQRREGQGTGQLYRQIAEHHGWLERGAFEELLGGLVRAGLLRIDQDSFLKNGRRIHFQRASLTRDGQRRGMSKREPVRLLEEPPATPKRRRRGPTATKAGPGATRAARSPATGGVDLDAVAAPVEKLVEALRQWRLAEARRQGVPAFHILSNRTLLAVVEALPASEDELLAVRGIGPTLTRKYGQRILELVREIGSPLADGPGQLSEI
ncbi:MAG: ATP-dependent DNA helicase RecQ [Thermoanaerobaculia bacterium]